MLTDIPTDLPYDTPTPFTGTFHPHPRGFGFIDLDSLGGQPADPTSRLSAFVPPPAARDLIEGDRITGTATRDERGLTLTRVRNIDRTRQVAIGTIARGRNRNRIDLHPQFGSGRLLPTRELAADLDALNPGMLVAVSVDPDADTSACDALVAGPWQPGTVAGARAIAACLAFGTTHTALPDVTGRDLEILRNWLDAVVAGTDGQTRHRAPKPTTAEPRTDLRDVTTVTIDGPTTRDLDDAISAQRLAGGNVRVRVHIADVAAHIAAGSSLDRRAHALATSVYPPTGVCPMLPTALSEDALSLLAGHDRDTLTVSYTVAPDGTTSDVELAVTRIRSDARLTYCQVQGHLDGRTPSIDTADTNAVWSTVAAAAKAATYLGRERDRRATLDGLFTDPAWNITLADGRLDRTRGGGNDDAQQLIERLMVAANESVADWLADRGTPALYRTHAGIDPGDVDLLDAALADAGETLAAYDATTVAGLLDRLDGPDAATVSSGVASSLTRATYTPKPDHHYGLDSKPYTHFTSPIRRYADLVVHRAVRATLAGEPAPYSVAELDDIGAWLDVRAGAAARCEALERALLWGIWTKRELDAGRKVTSSAEVRKVTPAGVSVRLTDLGVSAFIDAGRRRLEVRDDGLGSADGRWRVGQRLTVTVTGVDELGRLEVAAA